MELNNKNNEVVVVEGYHDLAKLISIYPNLDIVITNGSEISKETLEELKLLNEKRGLVLLLDPDFQGERIRKVINNYVGDTKHAFILKEKCISKNRKKVGIEHAENQDIINALSNVLTMNTKEKKYLGIQDMFDLSLAGHKSAKANRKKVTDSIGIGLSNAKTILKKLNMFNIKKEEIQAILRK